MISLRLFLLVLTTLLCRELASDIPANLFSTAAVAAAGVTLGFGLLFKASTLAILVTDGRCDTMHARNQNHRLHRVRVSLESLWVACLPLTLLATGWGAWLNMAESDGTLHAITLAGWCFPSLLFILLLELTSAQADEILLNQHPEADSRSDWKSLLWLRLRLGDLPSLATCLVPVFIIALASDTIGNNLQHLPADGLSVALAVGSGVLVFAVCLLLFPIALGRWFGVSRDVPSAMAARFHAICESLQQSALPLRIVRANGRWEGAALVGWFPLFRQLWVGDGLLRKLDAEELDMVLLHELAHVRRWHFVLRLSPIVLAAVALIAPLLCLYAYPAWDAWATELKLAGTVLAVVFLIAATCVVARRCELDADAHACELAEQACLWAGGDRAVAAAALGRGLTKLLGHDRMAGNGTWLHPSLPNRLRNLKF